MTPGTLDLNISELSLKILLFAPVGLIGEIFPIIISSFSNIVSSGAYPDSFNLL